jgi:hypothetical protein
VLWKWEMHELRMRIIGTGAKKWEKIRSYSKDLILSKLSDIWTADKTQQFSRPTTQNTF